MKTTIQIEKLQPESTTRLAKKQPLWHPTSCPLNGVNPWAGAAPPGLGEPQRKDFKMISALNFKPYDKGSLRGFFDLRYHGLIIKGCRLMTGDNGMWVALPQKEIETDGTRKWVDFLELARSEADHVRKLAVVDLESQGFIERQSPHPTRKQQPATRRTPEGEDLSQYYTPPGNNDGIPF
jgi:DNA-binding cell septation regulator SpoVG